MTQTKNVERRKEAHDRTAKEGAYLHHREEKDISVILHSLTREIEETEKLKNTLLNSDLSSKVIF